MTARSERLQYPTVLEQWWLERARRVTGHADTRAALDELEPLVSSLSNNFTKARSAGMGGYTADRKAWIAYGVYYFPQTCMRIRLIARELLARGWTPPPRVRVLDLGAGTGAAAVGLALTLERPVHATLVDQSPAALELGRELTSVLRDAGYPVEIETKEGDLRQLPEGRWDVVMASYALNEAFVEATEETQKQWLAAAAERLAEGGLLILCEPVVQEKGQQLAALRQWAIQEFKLRVLAPCLHEQACPLAARGEWCHDVRRWKVPESARHLNRHLHRSIEDLKFSLLVLAPGGTGTSGQRDAASSARIVAPVKWLKGKWQMTGCAGDGQVRDYEILRRGLSANDRRRMNELERGQVIALTDAQPAGSCLRGRLAQVI